MFKSLPERKGGPHVYPVLHVDETFHTKEMILRSGEAAQEAGAAGLFIFDETKRGSRSTKYLDGVLGLLQTAQPDFAFGVSYPKHRGVLAATYHVRGNLVVGEYEKEPMLWVDEPLAGTSHEVPVEDIVRVVKSPDLFTAETPVVFGKFAPGQENDASSVVDVAVIGEPHKRPALTYDQLSAAIDESTLPVAVAGLQLRDELFVLPENASAVILSSTVAIDGIISAQRVRGFVQTAEKIAQQKAEESTGSVA